MSATKNEPTFSENKMRANQEFEKLVSLIEWMAVKANGLALPADLRSTLAIRCFHAANEYQAAIAILYKQEMYGAAYALLRILAEALVKGMWLLHCATEKEMDQFIGDKISKTFQSMVDDVEMKFPSLQKQLSLFKENYWKALNGFTHTGIHQASRRQIGTNVESNYTDNDRVKLLKIANYLGTIAYGEIYKLAKRDDIVNEFVRRQRQDLEDNKQDT